MFCQSCGAKLPADANFCLKCGEKLKTGNVAVQVERILLKSKCKKSYYSRFFDTEGWEDATLIVTNKKVRVQWGGWSGCKHTADVPFNHIKRVQMKKGGLLSCHELLMPGVGRFIFDEYEEAVRVAELINSLI